MLTRAFFNWLLLLLLAIANGAAREFAIIPATNETIGHALSSVALSLAILLSSWLTIAWLGPVSTRDAWMIGGFWLMLTLAFEFLAGHYLFGNSWRRLLDDYNVFRGRLWILVLLATGVAPRVTAHLRGPIRRPALPPGSYARNQD